MVTQALDSARSVVLAAVPNAVGLSRAMVGTALAQWGLMRIADDAELVVSELVTNAVRAVGSVADRPLSWEELRDVGMIQVRAMAGPSWVIVAVWDSDPAVPQLREDAPDEAESGRGLVIVDALATRWGTYSASGGKVTWARVDAPPLPVTAAGLPQRVRAQVEPYAPAVQWNPDLLNRVYDGLKAL